MLFNSFKVIIIFSFCMLEQNANAKVSSCYTGVEKLAVKKNCPESLNDACVVIKMKKKTISIILNI